MTKKILFVGAIAALVTGNGECLLAAFAILWMGAMVLAACKGYPHHDR